MIIFLVCIYLNYSIINKINLTNKFFKYFSINHLIYLYYNQMNNKLPLQESSNRI